MNFCIVCMGNKHHIATRKAIWKCCKLQPVKLSVVRLLVNSQCSLNTMTNNYWHNSPQNTCLFSSHIYAHNYKFNLLHFSSFNPMAGFSLSRACTFFNHNRLSALSSAVSPLFIFSWKTDDLFCFFWSSLSLLFISLLHSGVFVISSMFLCCKKNCRSSCGGPIFVKPLFGRTCWLNPPL